MTVDNSASSNPDVLLPTFDCSAYGCSDSLDRFASCYASRQLCGHADRPVLGNILDSYAGNWG